MKQKQFLDLSGKYSSHGIDRHDGFFEKEVNFKLDSKNSDLLKGMLLMSIARIYPTVRFYTVV
jgi:hypothetical protein